MLNALRRDDGVIRHFWGTMYCELKGALTVKWVAVTFEDRVHAVLEQRIDLLCGDADTLVGREAMSFSIPVYASGVAALVRTDAPKGLKEILSGVRPSRPFRRASPAQFLSQQIVSVLASSPAQRWLARRLDEQLEIPAKVVPVPSVQAGVQRVVDRQSNVFFGERSLLLAVANQSPARSDLTVLDRRFPYVPLAIGMAW
jgi:putrescine:ornithine antiporter